MCEKKTVATPRDTNQNSTKNDQKQCDKDVSLLIGEAPDVAPGHSNSFI